MTLRIQIILCVLLSVTSQAASAKTSLDVEVGWEGTVRMGRWTPVQVTLSDPSQPSAVVEIAAAHDAIFTMRVHQFVGTLGAQAKTFMLYVPMNGYIGNGAGSALSGAKPMPAIDAVFEPLI